ncbi:SDR family oxidoreductase [Prochlorococcus marinus]|uniref:SDR family oxidoreductase n=1 Tax=Prochlorococcus marinus TaxID=1219 RepID=UPI001ADC699B|nr:SDR family oxidoreductase [Prochlorococcus marinus]MBO8204401.1 SDR family oxidoreductase [Prochlorococcus marinus CUG1415]MBW3043695.1 NADH-flavin reductase [Prochlorococcus marinus str. MU1415]
MKIAITGASGKTGFRIAEEAIKKGYKVRQIIRKNSKVSEGLESLETIRVSLDNKEELDKALKDIDALVIATGARASIDLTGPAKVDALGVFRQLESCKRVGIKRVILVSSLCTGKLFHPLNLFGLILIWKKIGENFLINSSFEWTIIRPGGLKENEDIKLENINYSKEDTQTNGSIPRRLVAKCCIESLKNKDCINKIVEVTSSNDNKKISFKKAMQMI